MALSNFDQRHNLAADVHTSAFGVGRKCSPRAACGGDVGEWTADATFSAHSGSTLTRGWSTPRAGGERDERIASGDTPARMWRRPIVCWFLQYVRVRDSCGRRLGTAPRNSIIGPGGHSVNAVFSRDMRTSGSRAVTLQVLQQSLNTSGVSVDKNINSRTFGQVTRFSPADGHTQSEVPVLMRMLTALAVAILVTATAMLGQQQPQAQARRGRLPRRRQRHLVDVDVRDKSGRPLSGSSSRTSRSSKTARRRTSSVCLRGNFDQRASGRHRGDPLAGGAGRGAVPGRGRDQRSVTRPRSRPSHMGAVFDTSSMQPEELQKAGTPPFGGRRKDVARRSGAVASIGSTLEILTDFTTDQTKGLRCSKRSRGRKGPRRSRRRQHDDHDDAANRQRRRLDGG